MAIRWINNIILKIASEVHKSKIDDFEKRMIEMEKRHDVIMKTIKDNENKLEKLEERIYFANLESSKASGAIQTLLQIQSKPNTNMLSQEQTIDGTITNKRA